MLSGSSRPRHLSLYEKLRPPGAVRLALQGPVRALDRLRRDGRPAFFTELGAVYPLLHILFDSQNPQRWVSEKIAAVEGEILIARRSRVGSATYP